MRYRQFAMFILIVFLPAACNRYSHEGKIEVKNPWVRAFVINEESVQSGSHSQTDEDMDRMKFNSAAYLLLINHGDEPERLLKAESDVADSVEIHISEMKDGVMRMRPVDWIEIPPRGQVELKPAGLHIMLVGVNRELVAGDKVDLVITFMNVGEMQVEAEVRIP